MSTNYNVPPVITNPYQQRGGEIEGLVAWYGRLSVDTNQHNPRVVRDNERVVRGPCFAVSPQHSPVQR